MQYEIRGNPDYGELVFQLDHGDQILVESGSMSRMSPDLPLDARVIGSKLGALARKLVGGESLFVGQYGGAGAGEVAISPGLPGMVMHYPLKDTPLRLAAGSFLACTTGVDLKTRFGGLKAFFSGEGAFFLDAVGQGDLFFNAYGGVIEKDLDGELIVDTGHLVAWEPSLDYKIGGMGGLKQTLFSGEGLVMRFSGRGKIWLQTRTLGHTAGWVTPFLRG
jgi:uncharacterized protein (TIGR00266 family)